MESISGNSLILGVPLLLAGLLVVYEDYRYRLIRIGTILTFLLLNTIFYISVNSVEQYGMNFVFCFAYCSMLYVVIHLYYFIKQRTIVKIIHEKIGLADVILLLAIGSSMPAEQMVYFFTFSFCLSAIIQILIYSRSKSIPLAGHLTLFYVLFLVFS